MRKVPFIVGQFYHIYNRGVDKRIVFPTVEDLTRFFQSMEVFNIIEPTISIYTRSRGEQYARSRRPTSIVKNESQKLVHIICYCLNPNHFHFLLEEIVEDGISEFMKRLGGYTKYFNEKYDRSGALFQGRFKSVHIASNAQLLHVSAYVNLNDRVHKISGPDVKLKKSSWNEYIGVNQETFCTKDMILGQFDYNILEYKKFAEETLEGILERRYDIEETEEIEKLLLE